MFLKTTFIVLGLFAGFTGETQQAVAQGPPEAHPKEQAPLADPSSATDKPATRSDAPSPEAGTPKVDWTGINGVILHERHFLVRTDGENIGAAKLEIREFQKGALLRTTLEYWLFHATGNVHQSYFWFQGCGSEFADRRPLAMWGAGEKGDFGMHFRVQGDGGWLNVKGNNYGKTRKESRIRPPKSFRLLNDLRQKMYDAIKGKGPLTFTWLRCQWRYDPITWHEYSYAYVGSKRIKTAEGSVVDVHRFNITSDDGTYPSETLWVDDEVYPVRRVVGGHNGFELLATEGKPHERMGQFPTWPQAIEKFGEAKLEHIMSAVDIAY